VIAGIESVDAAAGEWDALADRVGAGPFRRPGWLMAFLAAYPPDDLPRALTLRAARGGALRAVLPLVTGRGAARVPANAHTPAVGPVADGPESRARLAQALVGLRVPAVGIAPLDGEDPFAEDLRRAARARRAVLRERTVLRSPFADVPAEGPGAMVSRGMRKEIGRHRRRLAEQGELRLDIARGPEDGHAALADMVRIEALGWKGAEGTAIAADEAAHRLYAEITDWAARTGRLRLAVLRLDGRPVAAELDLAEDGALYSLKMGFDPAFAKWGPGHLLVAMLLEALAPEGVRRYEMLGDDDAYKMRWTDRVHEMREFTVYAPSPRGLAALGQERLGRAVRRRLRARRAVGAAA